MKIKLTKDELKKMIQEELKIVLRENYSNLEYYNEEQLELLGWYGIKPTPETKQIANGALEFDDWRNLEQEAKEAVGRGYPKDKSTPPSMERAKAALGQMAEKKKKQ